MDHDSYDIVYIIWVTFVSKILLGLEWLILSDDLISRLRSIFKTKPYILVILVVFMKSILFKIWII